MRTKHYVWKIQIGDSLYTPHCNGRGYDGEFFDLLFDTEEEALETLPEWLPFDEGEPLLCEEVLTVLRKAPPTVLFEYAEGLEIPVGEEEIEIRFDTDRKLLWSPIELPLSRDREVEDLLFEWDLIEKDERLVGEWSPYHLKSVGGFIRELK